MIIYLISLEDDLKRRSELARRFPETYPKMNWIKAINGKELLAKDYFYYASQYFNNHKKIITPSEVGCTLSHVKALKSFLKTDEEYALVLEDDIVGDDKSIEFIKNIIIKNKLNGVILCGGQIPLNVEKYKLCKHIKESLFIIPEFSKKFFFGTCCYVINRKTAEIIIAYQLRRITKADCWGDILKNHVNLYYIDILKHPCNIGDSHIEKERSEFYIFEPSFLKRIYKQGILWKISNRIRNDIYRWILILKGYRQIHKDKNR